MKTSMKILILAAFVICSTAFGRKFEGLALTPPMGWNSWNRFGCNVDEQMIRGMADGMVSSGMKKKNEVVGDTKKNVGAELAAHNVLVLRLIPE